MLILGIETTCDETAVSVVRDGNEILSNIVASQEALHMQFGGVVPELACRAHLDTIIGIIDRAVSAAKINLSDVDAIAVANTPGLVGAILIGLTSAKTLSWALNVPLIGVTHIHAHLYSINLSCSNVEYPIIGLAVSGGHTSLFYIENETKFKHLGGTLDDAAGEAFDKVAKMLNLGYPGGPIIDKLAKKGDKDAIKFPRSYLSKESLDFSFSGLKTAVLYHYQGQGKLAPKCNPDNPEDVANIVAGFQESVVEVLVNKTISAFEKCGVSELKPPCGIAIGGGVARNSRLRERLQEVAQKRSISLHYPSPDYCTDNAAMIAGLAYHQFKDGDFADLSLEAIPNYQRA